ncbi:endonuclease/exonuclease/phosphatase family protein [Streptomyces sp. NPDC051561]|uniref:endonuclease/exonuclease/phosphatase family protein n=1 Tax=Streptomyces sp. NPDC051561 TaxID=3365658 RepID=UPI0037A2514D
MDAPHTREASDPRDVREDVDEPRAATPPSRRRQTATWASALLLTGASIVIACRALGIDGVTPLPQLLAFLPWLLAPSLCALLLATLARNPLLIALALTLTAANAWYLRPYGTDTTPSTPALTTLRVLTANVEFGQATPALITAVRREKPDLVFVPECDYGCARALAKELPTASYPYREVIEAHGPEGSAILSTHPLRAAARIPSTLAMPGATAVVQGQEIRVQLAHPLPPVPRILGRWRSELRAIEEYAGAGSGPTLIAGDFNASQDHAAFRRILDAGSGLRDSAALAGSARTPTWPTSTTPVLGTQIDHVLVSKHFSVSAVRFLDLAGTDHRAVLADLKLHGG